MRTGNFLRLAAAFGAALVLALPAAAQTVRPNPDPAEGTGVGFVDYVGRYGEVFKLRGGWTIDAHMSGDIEVINLHPALRRQGPRKLLLPFKPKPSDFEPEKFTDLELIQLLIIPRSSDAFHSLDELKQAKLQDLKASGVDFYIIDRPHFPAFRGDWPAETFEIIVERPYRLTQLYTATSSFTCILTAGLDTPPSSYIRDHYSWLRNGLATWVVPQERPAPDESPSAIIAGGASFQFNPVIWLTWALITALGCLLAGGLQLANRWDALRRLSLTVVIFSNAGALLGAAFGLAAWPFAWFTHHLPIPGGLACLFMVPIAMLTSRRRGGARRRALIGLALWTAISAAFIGYYGLMYDWGGDSRAVIAYNAIVGFVFFAIGGFIFGLLDGPKTGSQASSHALALLALLTAGSARSQGIDPESFEAQARTIVAGRGTEEERRDGAIKALRRTQDIYNLQRVEIKGILAPNSADNDTNAVFGPLFDLQVAPTYLEGKGSSLPAWMRPSKTLADLGALREDAYGRLSAAAEAAVKQIGTQEVNEIVAHSWGTEIVYNAILAGLILPPKKLIVAGMPDGDLEKWKALSKFTGTQVIVYTNPNDPFAGAARLAGKVGEAWGDAERRMKHIPSPVPAKAALWQKWKSACAERRGTNPCNPRNRVPDAVAYKDEFKARTHDRFEYYQAMGDAHDLPALPPEQRVLAGAIDLPPFPGSAPALAAAQDALISREVQRLYQAEVREEVDSLVAAAAKAKALAAKAKGRFGFIKDVQEESVRARRAVQAQDDDYAAWYRRMDALLSRAEETRRQEKADLEYRRELGRHAAQFGYLSAAAGASCADSDAFYAEVGRGRYTSVSMDRSFLSEYLAMSAIAGGLSPCQVELLTKIKNAGRSVSWRELLEWGRQYREANPTIGRRVARALQAFKDSFRILDSGGSTESGSGSTESRSPSEDGTPRESPDHDEVWRRIGPIFQ